MDEKRLLQSLVETKLLTPETSEKILKESVSLKKSVEQIIYNRRLVDEEEVAKIKSKILGVPYKKIKPEEISGEILKLISEETAKTYKVIPLSKDKDVLVVGMINPDDARAQEALRFIAKQQKLNLGVFLITPFDADLVLRKYAPYATEVQAALQSLGIKPGKGEALPQRVVKLEEAADAKEAPIVRIVASTLKEAVNSNASDIHIEPQRDRLRMRFRIDGILQEIQSIPIELHQPIISRIKVLSDLKIDETRIPQDGRFRTLIFGRDIDFRVSTFPTPAGEKAAIRVLDPSTGLRSFGDLGLVGQNVDLIKAAIERPFGMILITGPTGSGKTTTLYALMQVLNKEDVNLVSLEEPVEYSIEGVNQSQVRPEIDYDFASGLRQILRQDPDVIMVGEIRDSETAALAVHAALTGHIVLSTLHTNNAVTVIPRLIDMKIEPFLLPTALSLMLSQRLVSKLCSNCKKTDDPSPPILEIIKKELGKLPQEIKSKYKESYKIYHSTGCSVCRNRGIVGRIAIFEVLVMTPELSEIISKGITESKISEEAKRQGMLTLRQDGILKALEGLIAIEEVLKETAE
jgi:type IV pilus assembly protein PilB